MDLQPSPLEAQIDVQVSWIESENDALARSIAALAGLEGKARAQASANIKRRQVRLKAALAHCDAAMDALDAEIDDLFDQSGRDRNE